jgi:hypothetical protein
MIDHYNYRFELLAPLFVGLARCQVDNLLELNQKDSKW